jgi:hypothetical protein
MGETARGPHRAWPRRDPDLHQRVIALERIWAEALQPRDAALVRIDGETAAAGTARIQL